MELQKVNGFSFVGAVVENDDEQKEHFLYSNKHEGEFLLPELQHFDFIWLIRDPFHDESAFSRIQLMIKEIPGVQLVAEVAHDKIKSKDNLQR